MSRDRLLARLREMREHSDWRGEREPPTTLAHGESAPPERRSVAEIDATLQQQIDQIAIAGLPHTIQFVSGCLTIRCRDGNIWSSNWSW
jgi:hypothetical protein